LDAYHKNGATLTQICPAYAAESFFDLIVNNA